MISRMIGDAAPAGRSGSPATTPTKTGLPNPIRLLIEEADDAGITDQEEILRRIEAY